MSGEDSSPSVLDNTGGVGYQSLTDDEHQVVATVFRPCSASSEKTTEANHQRSSSGWHFGALIANVCPSHGYPRPTTSPSSRASRGGTAEKYSNPAARYRPYLTNQGLRAAPTTDIDRHATRSHRGGHPLNLRSATSRHSLLSEFSAVAATCAEDVWSFPGSRHHF